MNFKEYSDKALRTKGDGYILHQLINGVMGLNGESGEVIDIVKKHLYQGHELDKNKLIDECGDVLWYLNLIAYALDVDLEHIAEYNISKLEKRYPKNKFRIEDSVNRKE